MNQIKKSSYESMRSREYYTKTRLSWLIIFIVLTAVHFIWSNSVILASWLWMIPSVISFVSFLADWNPIKSWIDYGRKHPILAEGDIIHLCLEQYGEIKPYFIREIIINRGHVENYNIKCPDYISLIPITLENAGLYTKSKKNITTMQWKDEEEE